MARKNSLKEIKKLSANTKNQVKQVKAKKPSKTSPTYSDCWEAWQCRGNAGNLANWQQVWEGSLEDCFERLGEEINCQLEEAINEDGSIDKLIAKHHHESEVLLELLHKLLTPKIAELKAQCLQNGECEGEGWAIASTPSKFKQQLQQDYPFACSDAWEAGALFPEEEEEVIEFDEEEFDDGLEEEEEEELGNWGYLAEGSLSECLEAIMFLLTTEVEIETGGQIADAMNAQDYFEQKTQLRSQKLEAVKQACLVNGEYKGDGWHIRSQRTREQCQWLAKNGHPVTVN
jgi:hypothetical protein